MPNMKRDMNAMKSCFATTSYVASMKCIAVINSNNKKAYVNVSALILDTIDIYIKLLINV